MRRLVLGIAVAVTSLMPLVGVADDPVSYTHLTLPTNREV